MGYSLDEWFNDNVLPRLKQFVAQTELEKPLNAECVTNVNAFLSMFSEILSLSYEKRKDEFAQFILTSILASRGNE